MSRPALTVHTRPRGLRALIGVAVGTLVVCALSGSTGQSRARQVDPSSPVAIMTRSPTGIVYELPTAAAGDVPNSGRGQYDWLQVPSPVSWLTSSDVYWRDQIQWGAQVERSRGAYDFSVFDRGLAEAEARHGRFMFRIMAYCPGCGDNLTPGYVPRQATGAPDWNSPEFLEAWERLMSSLGDRYRDDPRLGPVDVGGYGAWGEWLSPPTAGTPITPENANRMVRAVLDAFPHTFVLMNFVQPYADAAVALSPRVGLRFDCIGGLPLSLAPLPETVAQLWRRSPVAGEWCPTSGTTAEQGLQNVHDIHLSMLSSGNFPHPVDALDPADQSDYVRAYLDSGFRYSLDTLAIDVADDASGMATVTSTWTNSGVAPTYDVRRVVLQLRDGSGDVVWQAPLDVDLRLITQDRSPASYRTVVPWPRSLSGTYAATVVVEDVAGYLPPLRLANSQQQPDGSYWVGDVTIP